MLNIKETLSTFQQLKVLIIGDVMLDCYLKGTVNRMSPEAPVPVVLLGEKNYAPGGAANVALNVQSLGAKPYLFSVIGNDQSGKKLLDLLPESQISSNFIQVSENRKTTTKTRILSKNQQLLRIDEEDNYDLSVKEQKEFLTKLKKCLDLHEIDIILFQDYNKGVLTDFIIREVLMEALKRDIPTVVDPKYKNFFAYKRATLFKPNFKEVKSNLPFPCGATLEGLNKATDYINGQLNNPYTLITLSENGIYFRGDSQEGILPTNPRNIADVCGAGDSVVSIAALGLALNLPIEDIAQLSNLAGGQVCEKVGVVPVSRDKLAADYLELILGN